MQKSLLASILGMSLAASSGVAAQSVVGEIVLVGGECPAGFLPVDGAAVDNSEFPELAAVLNRVGQGDVIRIPTLDPIFAQSGRSRDVSDLPSPILAVLYRAGLSDISPPTQVKRYAQSERTIDPTNPSLFIREVNAFSNVNLDGGLDKEYIIRTKAGLYSSLGEPISKQTAQGKWYKPFVNFAQQPPVIRTVRTAAVDLEVVKAVDVSQTPGADVNPTTGDLTPKYCIAASGNTPALVEVGLQYTQETGASGKLEFYRVDVSGVPRSAIPQDFLAGNIDLAALESAVPGIGRPNVRFSIVGENACRAYETLSYDKAESNSPTDPPRVVFEASSAYPGEIRLTGVQISTDVGIQKELISWGDDFLLQRRLLSQGGSPDGASFTYTTQRDELNRPGFVAVDLEDDRSIVLENRNVGQRTFQYRVQAQCGDPGRAYNVYYDPQIEHDGRGGSGGYPY